MYELNPTTPPPSSPSRRRRRLQVGDVWEAVLRPRDRQADVLDNSDVDDNVEHDVVDTSGRKRLPVVDSLLIDRILAQAETQISDPPGFFFAAMPPVQRRPKSTGKSKANLSASARKRKGKPTPPKDGALSSGGLPQRTDPKDTDKEGDPPPTQPGGTEGAQPQKQAPPKKDDGPGGGSQQASGPQPSGGATEPAGPNTRSRPPEVVSGGATEPAGPSTRSRPPEVV
jgi:hypothetical protein